MLVLKNTVSEMNSFSGLISRLCTAEENISKPETCRYKLSFEAQKKMEEKVER